METSFRKELTDSLIFSETVKLNLRAIFFSAGTKSITTSLLGKRKSYKEHLFVEEKRSVSLGSETF